MPIPDPLPRSLYVIKAGGTFPQAARHAGDFEHWVMAGLGLPRRFARVLDARRVNALPNPAECAGVVMTGSHTMVTDGLPWMGRLAGWIEDLLAADVPFLGICFGHQLLAQALGGRVDYHPGGMEIGTVTIDLTPSAATDPLFSAMPARLAAHVVHAQAVLDLPAGATRLAGNAFEPNHAFRIGARAWGVQFHPEFNKERMALYVDHLAETLRAAGRDPLAIRANLAETPESAGLLPRFAALVRPPGRDRG